MFQPNMSYEWWVHWLFQCLPYSVYYCCSVLVPVTSLVPCDVMHGQYWAVLSDCRSYSIEVQQLLDDGSIGSNNQLTADSNQALAASGSLINPLTSPYPLHPYYLASFTLSYTPCWIPYSLYCTDTPLYRHFPVLPLYQLCTAIAPLAQLWSLSKEMSLFCCFSFHRGQYTNLTWYSKQFFWPILQLWHVWLWRYHPPAILDWYSVLESKTTPAWHLLIIQHQTTSLPLNTTQVKCYITHAKIT